MMQLDCRNKRVLIREDLNVPIRDGHITNDARIQAALPTIRYALEHGAAVILVSHLGRPTEGVIDEALSLAPVASALSIELQQEVRLIKDWLNGVDVNSGEVVLCENVRFNVGEKSNDAELSQKMAALCDVFVMDAFGTAHRAHASTVGIANYAKEKCAGPLLAAELDALQIVHKPQRPLTAIVGGSKVSSKLTVLTSLLEKVDQLIVGGGIANTFLAASDHAIGKSLVEIDLIPTAKKLLQLAKSNNVNIPLPTDVITAKEFSSDARAEIKSINEVDTDDMILDIGPQTAKQFAAALQDSKTIVWNGPVGVFEIPQFSEGTKTLAQAIAHSEAYSIAGGGDTLAAIDQFNIRQNISYISTGGGAFLEYMEGKELPAVVALNPA